MRYLYLLLCLPYWGAAQSLEIRVSQCSPSESIEVQIDTTLLENASYQIFRKPEKGDWTLLRTQTNSIFRDTAKIVLTGEPFYYQVKAGSFQSNIAGGYICPKKGQIPVIPYTPDSLGGFFNLSWSAIWGVKRYEIQIAKRRTDFSLKTGFKNPIWDSITNDNNIRFKFPKDANEIYWTVRCITGKNHFYYMNPIKFTRPDSESPYSVPPRFANDLKISLLTILKDSLKYNLTNTGTSDMHKLQIHYFLSTSDDTQFSKDAILMGSGTVIECLRHLYEPPVPNQKMPPNSLPLSYKLNAPKFKGKTLLIVPSMGNVFSSQVIGFKKL
jgi:hypothetical protein